MTNIYYKPSDTHQYLHFNSGYPRHMKRPISYNLSRTIYAIVNSGPVKTIQRITTQSMTPIVTTYNLLRNLNVTHTVKHLNEVLKTVETFSKIFENLLTVKDN